MAVCGVCGLDADCKVESGHVKVGFGVCGGVVNLCCVWCPGGRERFAVFAGFRGRRWSCLPLLFVEVFRLRHFRLRHLSVEAACLLSRVCYPDSPAFIQHKHRVPLCRMVNEQTVAAR